MSDQQTEKSGQQNLGEFMRVMDIVDLTRRSDKAVRKNLNIDEEKAQLKEKLRETYSQMGTTVEDSQLDRAVEDYYSKKWEFKAPTEGVQTALAKAYINRGWITKHVILPAVGMITAGTLAVHGVNAAMKAHQEGLERRVEFAIERDYAKVKDIESSSKLVSASPFVNQLPSEELQNMKNAVVGAQTKLDETDPFFEKFCPSGVSDDAITLSNYQTANEELRGVEQKISAANSSLDVAKGLIIRQQQFNETEKNLEGLLGSVKTLNPVQPLLARAETVYEQGKQNIKTRRLEEAQGAVKGLTQVFMDCRDFSSLVQQSSQLYNAANKIAIENIAKEKIAKMKDELDSYVAVADVAHLRTTTQQFAEISQELNQEYTIEVLNRPGIRTGLWRHSNDHPARSSSDEDPVGKRFYLVVHAVAPNGQEISVKKRNVEDGTVNDVTIWGEKVPHEVYLRVKQDKMDNGLVDNSTSRNFDNRYIGKKVRGYLSVSPLIKDNSGRYNTDSDQLTKEERNWRTPSQ